MPKFLVEVQWVATEKHEIEAASADEAKAKWDAMPMDKEILDLEQPLVVVYDEDGDAVYSSEEE